MIWYYAKDGQQHGPIDSTHLKELASKTQLAPGDLVWRPGMSHWAPASKVHGLFEGIFQPPPLPNDAHKIPPPPLTHVMANEVPLRHATAATPKTVGSSHLDSSGAASPAVPSTMKEKSLFRTLGGPAIVGIFVAFWLIKGCSSTPGGVEAQLEEKIQGELSANMQALFKSIHPIGSATGVKVEDVTINAWKSGSPTNRLRDVREFTLHYVLYWKGPIQNDGFTEIESVYDVDQGGLIGSRILATNGTTNPEAEKAVLAFGLGILGEAIRNSNQGQ